MQYGTVPNDSITIKSHKRTLRVMTNLRALASLSSERTQSSGWTSQRKSFCLDETATELTDLLLYTILLIKVIRTGSREHLWIGNRTQEIDLNVASMPTKSWLYCSVKLEFLIRHAHLLLNSKSGSTAPLVFRAYRGPRGATILQRESVTKLLK